MQDEVKITEEAAEPTVKTVSVDIIGGYTLPGTLNALREAKKMEQRYLRKAKRAWRGHTREAFMKHAAHWQMLVQEHNLRLAQFEKRFVDSIAATMKAEAENAKPAEVKEDNDAIDA